MPVSWNILVASVKILTQYMQTEVFFLQEKEDCVKRVSFLTVF